jgi:hypothetical protein
LDVFLIVTLQVFLLRIAMCAVSFPRLMANAVAIGKSSSFLALANSFHHLWGPHNEARKLDAS